MGNKTVVCSFDTRVLRNEKDKIENYHDLALEIKRI